MNFALVLKKSTNGLWTQAGNHVICSTCSWHLFSLHSLKMRLRIRWGFFCLFLFLAKVWVKTLLYSLFLVKNSLSGLLHYMTMALKIWRQSKLIVILRPYTSDVVVFCSLVFSSCSGWKMFTLNHNWREARWFLLFLIGDRERSREVTINEVILCISFLSENKITVWRFNWFTDFSSWFDFHGRKWNSLPHLVLNYSLRSRDRVLPTL